MMGTCPTTACCWANIADEAINTIASIKLLINMYGEGLLVMCLPQTGKNKTAVSLHPRRLLASNQIEDQSIRNALRDIA
jgi:hypothetical protein